MTLDDLVDMCGLGWVAYLIFFGPLIAFGMTAVVGLICEIIED